MRERGGLMEIGEARRAKIGECNMVDIETTLYTDVVLLC